MLIHPPVGYLIGAAMRHKYGAVSGLMAACVLGSAIPDIDMARFWFIDHGRYNHRYYFTHWPLFWLGLSMIVLPLLYGFWRRWLLPAVGFVLGVASHLITDTVMGPVRWLAPFSDRSWEMFRVPASHGHWILSSIGYWTFLLDVGALVLAIIVWRWSWKPSPASAPQTPAGHNTRH